MVRHDVEEDAATAVAEDGLVILEGAKGAALTFTPNAAELTADRLSSAAKDAAQQGSLSSTEPVNDADYGHC